MEADFVTNLFLPVGLFIIMLGMGLTLTVADFTRILRFPRGVAIGVLCQMGLLPLLGFAVATVTGLGAELAVGLMILSFCPGGTTSNIFSFIGRGDVALSITLTAIVSLVTPFSIPLLSQLAIGHFMGETSEFAVPLLDTIKQLLVITAVPVGIGMIIRHFAPHFSTWVENPVKVFSVVLFLSIIVLIVIRHRDAMLGYFTEVGVAALLLNVVAMTVGYFVASAARISRPQQTTICFEVGIQNSATALLVTGTLLESPIMSVPAVVYGLLMLFTGGAFASLANRRQLAAQQAG